MSLHASLLPDRLGANSVLTLAFRFSGGEEGVPPALRSVVVRWPAGLRINLGGVSTCALSRLQRRGPKACPSASLIGRGHALLDVHAGSQAVPEEAMLSIFRAPGHGALPTFAVYGHGETPLDQSAVATEIVETDKAPYGWRTVTTIPPIPTVMYEPDASFVSISLTVGSGRHPPRAHAAGGSILVPRSCPTGGFPFASEARFADGTSASTSTVVGCP